ncbi:MAG: ferritin family protein [Clostridia bacterium]
MDIDLTCNDRMSYPMLLKQNTNSYYAGLLQNLFCGDDSEVCSFLSFRYYIYCLSPFYESVVTVLQKIAQQELKHQEILANAIIMLGKNPVYYDAQCKWFSTRSIDYIKNLKDVLSFSREKKEKAIIDYKLAMSKISNFEIKNLLERILIDEEKHLEWILKLYGEFFSAN